MIDLHCHLLPGIDDGPATLSESIDMAKVAVEQGITHILCTPHHNNGLFNNRADDVIYQVAELQKELDAREIELVLYEGQEVHISEDLFQQIQEELLLFVDLKNQYLLIEFPSDTIPDYAEQLLFQMRKKGLVPVIVHPERNQAFIDDPNRLLPFLEMGVLTQMTAPSYTGVFGRKIQQTAKKMLRHNMIYMLASDAHNTEKRTFFMKKAYAMIEKDLGKRRVTALQRAAKMVLNGEAIAKMRVKEIKKRNFSLF